MTSLGRGESSLNLDNETISLEVKNLNLYYECGLRVELIIMKSRILTHASDAGMRRVYLVVSCVRAFISFCGP
ncbi:MAG: hypothetical protein DRR08_02695 [Candidatus Parabeggiatoa sp. nov. 2]|nr:MAG: hypothetical protein DRR08_02695 [Gammaproteobacteria bacterium]